MSWVYSQRTGRMTHSGQEVGVGYSGRGPGKNNPSSQGMHNVGQTPAGRYSIGPPHLGPSTGAYTMSLTPLPGTNTFGRTDLKIHGESSRHPGDASSGCVVITPNVRHQIWNSNDHVLEVVP